MSHRHAVPLTVNAYKVAQPHVTANQGTWPALVCDDRKGTLVDVGQEMQRYE
jgi:hypothetical protein